MVHCNVNYMIQLSWKQKSSLLQRPIYHEAEFKLVSGFLRMVLTWFQTDIMSNSLTKKMKLVVICGFNWTAVFSQKQYEAMDITENIQWENQMILGHKFWFLCSSNYFCSSRLMAMQGQWICLIKPLKWLHSCAFMLLIHNTNRQWQPGQNN